MSLRVRVGATHVRLSYRAAAAEGGDALIDGRDQRVRVELPPGEGPVVLRPVPLDAAEAARRRAAEDHGALVRSVIMNEILRDVYGAMLQLGLAYPTDVLRRLVELEPAIRSRRAEALAFLKGLRGAPLADPAADVLAPLEAVLRGEPAR